MAGEGSRRTVADLDAAPVSEVESWLAATCSSTAWVRHVVAARPWGDRASLVATAVRAVVELDGAGLAEALAGHPRIGEPAGGASSREQSGVTGADAETRAALAEGNREYEWRFGHVYLVRAAGRDAEELLALLRERLGNDPRTEREVVRRELADITRLRLERMIAP